MKIASIETVPIAIPHDHGGPPTGFGGRSWPTLSVLLVKVETDDGFTGWGEAFSYGCMGAVKAVVEETIAPLVIGRDSADIVRLSYDLQQGLHLFGRYGITMFGISGIDIALWDIAGKRAGLPVCQLLGGTPSALPMPGYASLLKYGDPDLVAQHSSEAVDAGYPMLKLHETQVPEVTAARLAVGPDVPIAVDTNCPWTPREAHEMAARLSELDPFWQTRRCQKFHDPAGGRDPLRHLSVRERHGAACFRGTSLRAIPAILTACPRQPDRRPRGADENLVEQPARPNRGGGSGGSSPPAGSCLLNRRSHRCVSVRRRNARATSLDPNGDTVRRRNRSRDHPRSLS